MIGLRLIATGRGFAAGIAALTGMGLLCPVGSVAEAAPMTVFPKNGWGDVRIERHEDRVVVKAGDDWMQLVPRPNNPEYAAALVVSNASDMLFIDARETFRRGASSVSLTGGRIDPKPYHGREAVVLTEWSGARGSRMTAFIEGCDTERRHWYRHGKCEITPRRRAFRQIHKIDENVAELHWRLDINDARRGPLGFYGAKFGELTDLALKPQAFPKQELLFHADFDGTLEAETAKGGKMPDVVKGVTFAPGRRGQSVRFTAASRAVLGYPAQGNVRPECGTMSFWFKREWPERDLGVRDGGVFRRNDHWRMIFSLADEHRRPQAGGLGFWWWGPTLRVDRGDLDDRFECLPELVKRKESEDWCHYVFVWTDAGTTVYFNGDTVRPGVIGDSYSPQRHALEERRPPLEFDRAQSVFKTFFVGSNFKGDNSLDGCIDDLKIWSAPMRQEEALLLYWKEMDARMEPDVFYGTDDEAKTVTLNIRHIRGGRSLAGLQPKLYDAAGRPVATGSALGEKGGESRFSLKLQEGEYRFGFDAADGVSCRSEPYWVLARGNAVSMPPTDRAGVPAAKKLLYTVKPDLATLTTNEFRSVHDCRMGKLGDVSYLEAGDEQCDRFAIRLHFETNVPLHLVEIDYPDDKYRTMDIVLQKSDVARDDYTLQVGRMCGDEYPLTHRILTHRCLYWTQGADCSLIAMTARKNSPAAIAEIRVYEVPGGCLPVAKCRVPDTEGPHRVFGSQWEDPAINHDFGATHGSEKSLNLLIDRMAAYMKYQGQDVLVYPGAFYQGLIAHGRYNPRAKSRHFLQAWMEKFDHEDLGVIPKINLQCVPFDDRVCTRETMQDGSLHPTALAIWNTGKPSWGGWHGQPPNFNISHPDVQAEVEKVFDALVADGKGHPSFRGICFHLTSITCPWWGSIVSGYNDYTIAAFERDEKVKVRGVGEEWKSPLRGKLYYEKIAGDPALLEKWVTWRCRVLTDFYARLAKKIADIDPALVFCVYASPNFDGKYPDFGSADFIRRTYREAGIDVRMLQAAIPNLVFCRGVSPCGWRQSLMNAPLPDDIKAKKRAFPDGAAFWSAFKEVERPWLNQHDNYWENDSGARRVGKDVLSCSWLDETRWRVSTLNANEPYSMKYYALPFKYGDMLGFTRGGFLIGSYGSEESLARFAQYFRALPAVKFTETLLSGDIVARTAKWRGVDWYYLVNVTDQEREATVTMPDDACDLVTGENVGGTRRFRLAPYEFRSFATAK